MKYRFLLLAISFTFLVAAESSAQAYRGGYGYRGSGGYGGGWGYAGAGSTAFGGALLGMGALTQAAGSYNLNTAAAGTYYQQAYSQWIQNQKLREQTYFDMRRMNASYRAEEAMLHPHATPEEIREFSHSRLPAELSVNEFDPAHGVIEWPALLNRAEFKDDRARLEGLFSEAAADPHGSGLGTQNYRDIQDAVGQMNDRLRSEIKQFGPDEYIPASKFLKSLAFEARTPGGNPLGTK
ncbi:MAG TPA: hypothetical protein VG125_19945 [Pirellulales bacterium]|jgi:hypothetical protein|nr:hypothetical protein [Pirellulales bacterium]